jgi:thioredoxin-related protein
MFRRALLVLPAAALLLAAAPARACDIKIHDAALNEWPRAYYLLYLVHSNTKPLTAAQEDLTKRLREKHFAEVNADVVKLNLDGSMLREDREFLSAQGCNGWPQVVILGKDGKEVVRTSGPLEKKDFTRLGERVGELSPGARALVLAPKSDEKAWKAAGEVSAEALAAAGLKDLKPELLDTGDAANQELAARYAPPALPAMFLVSPRGSLLASYPGEVKEAELLKAFDSPARKDLTKALEKAAIAFIFVPGKDKKASSAAADRLKTAVKRGEKLLHQDRPAGGRCRRPRRGRLPQKPGSPVRPGGGGGLRQGQAPGAAGREVRRGRHPGTRRLHDPELHLRAQPRRPRRGPAPQVEGRGPAREDAEIVRPAAAAGAYCKLRASRPDGKGAAPR